MNVSPQASGDRTGAPINWRQFAGITVAALAIFVALRLLPTGTNLSHLDFRATGTNAIEFCDPLNPQFISVVSAKSPVTMEVKSNNSDGLGFAQAGQEIQVVVSLRTGSGKPIRPEDLLVTHTKRLHLLIVDPLLWDYQHVHPEPGNLPGEWHFKFKPRLGGVYRIFADFTPAATARGLYASADLQVEWDRPRVLSAWPDGEDWFKERGEFRFSFLAIPNEVRAGLPADLGFSISRNGGGPVPMQPVMGAYAHLVAFDSSRSGFAHLHPVGADPLAPPDSTRPSFYFKLTIPLPGVYTVWAQVNIEGREVFVPFRLEVR